MAEDVENAIRVRAYEIWEAEGRPEGRASAHWLQAEQEFAAGDPPILETGQPLRPAKGQRTSRAKARGAQPA